MKGQPALKRAGIDEVLVFCAVDNAAVMEAWAKDQMIEGSNIEFLADTASELTTALGTELVDPGPVYKLGKGRTKRFAAYYEDGVCKVFNISEKPDDPAGDDFPESSCIDNMLKEIGAL